MDELVEKLAEGLSNSLLSESTPVKLLKLIMSLKDLPQSVEDDIEDEEQWKQ